MHVCSTDFKRMACLIGDTWCPFPDKASQAPLESPMFSYPSIPYNHTYSATHHPLESLLFTYPNTSWNHPCTAPQAPVGITPVQLPMHPLERPILNYPSTPWNHPYSATHHPLEQGFPTCGTWRSSRWYASNFRFFFTKTWIQIFLVYVPGFVSK